MKKENLLTQKQRCIFHIHLVYLFAISIRVYFPCFQSSKQVDITHLSFPENRFPELNDIIPNRCQTCPGPWALHSKRGKFKTKSQIWLASSSSNTKPLWFTQTATQSWSQQKQAGSNDDSAVPLIPVQGLICPTDWRCYPTLVLRATTSLTVSWFMFVSHVCQFLVQRKISILSFEHIFVCLSTKSSPEIDGFYNFLAFKFSAV